MPLDDLVLRLQRLLDRLVRRLYLGRAPEATQRRVLIVQIDGLSRSVLEQALADRTVPFLAKLLRRRGWLLTPMSVGLPASTPAFQMSVMYGVRPDIPGFHYHDKRRRSDVYFPRGHDSLLMETAQAQGRRGILEEGSAYGCVFTGGATSNLLTFAMIRRPSRAGVLRMVSQLVVVGWVLVKCCVLSAIQVTRALLRFVADPVGESARGWRWLAIKIGISVWLRELFTLAVARDLYAGVPAIYVNYLDYDVFAHAYGPRHGERSVRSAASTARSTGSGGCCGVSRSTATISTFSPTTARRGARRTGGCPAASPSSRPSSTTSSIRSWCMQSARPPAARDASCTGSPRTAPTARRGFPSGS